MTFDDNAAYWKSNEVETDEYKEHEAPKEEGSGQSSPFEHLVDHQEETEGPNKPVSLIAPEIKKRPAWLSSTL